MADDVGGDLGDRADTVELVVVTMRFDADADDTAADRLAAVLARYVVLTRMEPGCRNVDLCAAAADPRRVLVIEKWSSPAAQRVHLDGDAMVAMAEACRGVLAGPPQIELWDGVSAHDLA